MENNRVLNQLLTHPAYLMPREPKLSLRNLFITFYFETLRDNCAVSSLFYQSLLSNKHHMAVRLSWLKNPSSRPLFSAGDFDP